MSVNSQEDKYFRRSISFPMELKQKLDIMASKDGRSFNSMVIKVLNDYLRLMEVTGLDVETMTDYSFNALLDAIREIK